MFTQGLSCQAKPLRSRERHVMTPGRLQPALRSSKEQL